MIRLGLLLGVLCGCGPVTTVTPASGSSFGYYPVQVEADALQALEEPLTVTVGGLGTYGVSRVDARTVRFMVQGSPTPGPAPIVVSSRRSSVAAGTFTWRPSADARLDRLVALGASLTMGSQNASITPTSQLMGPVAQLARATGAYFPLPLVRPGVLPQLLVSDIDPVTCRPSNDDVFSIIGARAQDQLLSQLKDSSGEVRIARAREDATREVHNVAIGGFRIDEALHGSSGLFNTVLEHLVWQPDVDTAGLIQAPTQTMVDRVEALAPSVVVTTDLFGNDYNNVNLYAEGLPDLSALTPTDQVRRSLQTVLRRVDATGAELFIGTGPDNTVLGLYARKVSKLKAAGVPEPQASAWVDAIRARIDEYNQVLRAEAAAYPRVHLVDFHALVADVLSRGADVGNVHLSPAPFSGLLSLDSMHFTNTGYALLANAWLDAMDRAWGTTLPRVDLAAVLAEDPLSVGRLREAGLSCAGN